MKMHPNMASTQEIVFGVQVEMGRMAVQGCQVQLVFLVLLDLLGFQATKQLDLEVSQALLVWLEVKGSQALLVKQVLLENEDPLVFHLILDPFSHDGAEHHVRVTPHLYIKVRYDKP